VEGVFPGRRKITEIVLFSKQDCTRVIGSLKSCRVSFCSTFVRPTASMHTIAMSQSEERCSHRLRQPVSQHCFIYSRPPFVPARILS
jgi:hypothetical protein